MKKVFTLLVSVLFGVSFAQTKEDVITSDINLNYLNSLVQQNCNERTKDSSIFKKSNPITFKCAEYQSAYQAKYSICTHTNTEYFRGYVLKTMVDRRDMFNKPVQLMSSMGEICTFAKIEYGVTTYEELANHIMDNFFNSTPHKKTIFVDYPYGNFSCTQGEYDGQKGVYVTGVFSR